MICKEKVGFLLGVGSETSYKIATGDDFAKRLFLFQDKENKENELFENCHKKFLLQKDQGTQHT